MIKLACKIPRKIVIAVSGGPDSMALLNFCFRGRKDLTALHIDHKTKHAKDARKLVEGYCKKNNIPLVVNEVSTIEHNELVWRNERLRFYHNFTKNGVTVATAHHLGDVAEWYLFTALHGDPKFMSAVDEEHKLIKPFLFTAKQELIDWCHKFEVPYVIDPTNEGEGNARAIMRGIMPELLKVHSGFHSSIRNKMMKV